MTTNRYSKFFGRIAGAFPIASRRKVELDYLNQSKSIAELEHHQHEIDAGKFHSF